jgi:hypothetical protein
MHVFKTDTKLYLTNELKSWAWTTIIGILLVVILKSYYSLPQDKLLIGIAGIFLLKLGDTLTRFHVKEIKIDTQAKQLTFILNSIMSGQKNRIYDLRKATSELTHNSTLTKILYAPLTLKIFLPQKGGFRINGRYGFSTHTLEDINNALKSAAIS